MKEWEYKKVENFKEVIRAGFEGWELVCVSRELDSYIPIIYYLKRSLEIKEREER